MIRALLSQSVVYGGTTIAARGSLLVLLLVLPFILSPEEYGALALIMAIAPIANILIPLEITQGLLRFYPSASPDAQRGYAGSAWWFTAAALFVFLLVALAAAEPLATLTFGDQAYLAEFRFGVLYIAAASLFYFLQNLFRWQFRSRGFAIVTLAASVLTLSFALWFGSSWADDLQGVLLGLTAGTLLASAVGAWQLRASLAARPEKAKLAQMLRLSLPLVPAGVALLLSLSASRFVLNAQGSLGDVGIFTFASQVAGIATLSIVGVQAALTPLIMAHFEDPATPPRIARVFEVFVAGAIVICLLLGLFSPELIVRFGSPEYHGAAAHVLVLSFAVVIAGIYYFAPGFLIGKKTSWQMGVSLTTAAVAIVLNIFLIRAFGIGGAVAATFLCSLFFATSWFMLSDRLYAIPIRWRRVVPATAFCLGLGLAGLHFEYRTVSEALLVKSGLVGTAALLLIAAGLVPLRTVAGALRSALRPAGPQGLDGKPAEK